MISKISAPLVLLFTLKKQPRQRNQAMSKVLSLPGYIGLSHIVISEHHHLLDSSWDWESGQGKSERWGSVREGNLGGIWDGERTFDIQRPFN